MHNAGIACAYNHRMFGLRQKLLLGFGGLLALMLVVDCLGIAVTLWHRGTLDRFLTENWRSVDYGQHMVDSVDHLDEMVRRGDLPAHFSEAKSWIDLFDRSVDNENHNVTLPGEQKDADDVTLNWTGSDRNGRKDIRAYRPAISQLLNPKTSVTDRAAALTIVQQASPVVKDDAQKVIKLNFDNLTPVNQKIKTSADRAEWMMVLATVAGTLLSVLFVLVMSRTILLPIQTLTRSAKEIEKGNLDLVVQVKTRDELRDLAEAFNSMAAKLREYRRSNRAKLIRTQATTQLAINSLPDVVAIIGPDGRIEMANASAEKLFGLKTDSHVSDSNCPWLVELYRKTSTDHLPVEPRGYETAVQVLESGSERFFLPHATPILDVDRALLGVTVVLADVTNLRRLDEMKSGMLSVVSHELKTPLTSIRMGCHLLLEERMGELNEQQTEIMLAIRDDSNRLHQIIENLLDMGRMESGRGVMDLKPHTLQEIVTHATEPVESAFRDRGVSLSVSIDPELPRVLVDPARIGHVFSNLLSNALKHTPAGGEVSISAAAVGSMIGITVRDTGSGIPDAYIARIFERFFRVPGQSGNTGAGMGLAIAKEIVELHGGRLTVASKQGRGSTFTFTLAPADAVEPTRSRSVSPMGDVYNAERGNATVLS
jgi:NtrC-family two-component system sensor histidine kinase KinB